MKKFLPFFLFSFISLSQAQIVEWYECADKEFDDACVSHISDNSNSFYSVIHTNSSGQSGLNDTYCYIRKTDYSGRVIWNRCFDPGYYGGVGDVKSDHNGSLFLNIMSWGSTHFFDPPDFNSSNPDTVISAFGTCILKLDTNGTIHAADKFYYRTYCGFDNDNAGNKYFFGYLAPYNDKVRYNNDSVTLTNKGSMFLMKANPQGSISWIKEFPARFCYGDMIKVAGNKIIFGGEFVDSLTVNSTKYLSMGDRDIFLGAADLNGNILWFKTIAASGYDYLTALTTSEDGSKLFFSNRSSHYNQNTYLHEPATLSFGQTTLTGSYFFSLLDSDGNYLWTKTSPRQINGAALKDTSLFLTGQRLVAAKYNLNGKLIYSKPENVTGLTILPITAERLILGGGIFRSSKFGEFIPWYNYYSNHSDIWICSVNFHDYHSTPIAIIDTTSKPKCSGDRASIINLSENADSINWFIQGAIPEFGNDYSTTCILPDSGTYSLKVVAYHNGLSDTLHLSNYYVINPTPQAVILGDLEVCKGDTVRLSGPSGVGMTYQWGYPYSESRDTQFVMNEYVSHISLYITQYGCWSRIYATVTALNQPSPIISELQGQLQVHVPVTGNYTYQWLLNDDLLNDSDPVCDVSDIGIYTVIVTDTNGCSGSIDHKISVLNKNNVEESSISVYPNPTNENIQINLGQAGEFAIITITDTRGSVVMKKQISDLEVIPVSGLAKGNYLVTVIVGEKKIERNLVVN